jgi:predicted lipoprotein with Yx(FWY)xxD motif
MKQRNLFNPTALRVVMISISLLIAAGLAAQIIPPTIKAPEVTVKGEIVDLYCNMRGDLRGMGHKTCSTKCANQGNPIGFLDAEKGEMYTLLGRADYQATHIVRDELMKRMNETVTLSGPVIKKGNTQILYVNTIDGKAVEAKQ